MCLVQGRAVFRYERQQRLCMIGRHICMTDLRSTALLYSLEESGNGGLIKEPETGPRYKDRHRVQNCSGRLFNSFEEVVLYKNQVVSAVLTHDNGSSWTDRSFDQALQISLHIHTCFEKLI